MQYQITGDWTAADSSEHTLESAPTSEKDIFAVRQRGDTSHIFTTLRQVERLAASRNLRS